MTPPPKATPRGGAAAMLTLFALAAGGAGLGFDLALNPDRGFWIGAEPGARAAIGAAAAMFVIVSGHVGRLLLARRERRREGRDAGRHA
jgi:hypothetical protein